MFYKNDILKTLESLQSKEVLSVKAKKRKEQQINEFLVRSVSKHGLVEQNVCQSHPYSYIIQPPDPNSHQHRNHHCSFLIGFSRRGKERINIKKNVFLMEDPCYSLSINYTCVSAIIN